MQFIGIDIGTTSVCAIVFDQDTHKTESRSVSNDTWLSATTRWEKAQDPTKIIELVQQLLSELITKYKDIKGIGVTGQMHGILYIDSNGDAVSPLYTWQDARGNEIYKGDKTYAGYLSDITGYSLATGYGLVTHFYNVVNNLIPPTAKKLCTIMDYVVMKLIASNQPLMDCSNAASLGFFDVEHLSFDHKALEKVAIDTSFLPQIASLDTPCGYMNGIPVYPAIGDNPAAFMGSVQDINQSVHVTVGTSSQISVYSKQYLKLPNIDTRPFPGGGYILVGAALCGGQAFALLKTFYEQVVEFLGLPKLDDTTIYKAMTSIDHQMDSSLMVSTLFNGTRQHPNLKGTISNISRDNFTPQDLTIGFLKGIAEELYNFYQTIPDSIKHDKKMLVGSGNGLKKNKLLGNVFEDTFGYKLYLSDHEEEAALGACMISKQGYQPDRK